MILSKEDDGVIICSNCKLVMLNGPVKTDKNGGYCKSCAPLIDD